MSVDSVRAESRRRFLQYLAASPLFAATSLPAFASETPSKWPDPMIWTGPSSEAIKSPKDAINVFDFEPAAFKNVPPAHFGYMASGLDDEVTLRANREGFLKFQLRPRRLVDCQHNRHDYRYSRYEIRQPDCDRTDRQQQSLPCGRRGRDSQSRKGRQSLTDPLDCSDDLDRGRDSR